ncbi:hypothetical protein NESM_000387000 [Novymonas esmeraldas]|uniref:SET domain-containing protein n=1 Tax=Novymonas esmeraldas TaxID=1808958 RepID=A0AAW0EKR4_9TRYP
MPRAKAPGGVVKRDGSPPPPALDAREAPAFQLAVINSCLTNEDVRLPRLPTPGLLTGFYDQYDPAATATAAPWKGEYWRTRVAHAVLGRHSALPAAYRLGHECVARLHARVVFVRTGRMHRQLCDAYPPLQRVRPSGTAGGVEEEEEQEEDGGVGLAQCTEDSVDERDAMPLAFAAPYYLLINHSANPVFVGVDRVPQGRSVALEEGDIVSVLECAFEDDGGVLDAVEDAGSAGSGEADVHGSDATLTEQVPQLARESLSRCVTAVSPPQPTTPSPPPLPLAVHVSGRIVARRRLYTVSHMIQEYVRWWHQYRVPAAEPQANGDSTHRPPSRSPTKPRSANALWMVSGNHLVRAPSITGAVAPAPTSGSDGAGGTGASPPLTPSPSVSPCPSRKRSRSPLASPSTQPPQILFSSVPHSPDIVAALRRWLRETEDMEEVADEVHSPLAARLTLDRAWLWQLVRHGASLRHAPSTPPPRRAAGAALSPSPVEVGDAGRTKGGGGSGDTPSACGASAALAERFRVSLPSTHSDTDAVDGAAARTLAATPPRSPSVVQSALEELRRRRGPDATPAAPSGVRRSLCLDDDPIEVYTDDPARAVTPHANLAAPRRTPSASQLSTAGLPTCVPAVHVRPAALPVYVFTRRSRSPDVDTREQSALVATSTATGQARGAGAAKQFVYYYDESDTHHPAGDGVATAARPPPQPRSRHRRGRGGRAGRRGASPKKEEEEGNHLQLQQHRTAGRRPPLTLVVEPALAATGPPPQPSPQASASAVESGFLWVDEAEKRAVGPRTRRPTMKTALSRAAPVRRSRAEDAAPE